MQPVRCWTRRVYWPRRTRHRTWSWRTPTWIHTSTPPQSDRRKVTGRSVLSVSISAVHVSFMNRSFSCVCVCRWAWGEWDWRRQCVCAGAAESSVWFGSDAGGRRGERISEILGAVRNIKRDGLPKNEHLLSIYSPLDHPRSLFFFSRTV